jgi:hypothetical protein
MTPRSAHARVLADLIAKARHEHIDWLIRVPDQRTAGFIDGLDVAIQLSEEADLKLSGGLSVSA